MRSFDEAKFSFKAGSGLEVDSIPFYESTTLYEIDGVIGFNGGERDLEEAIEEDVNFL